jgi:eukaryotic-like serine/threonine-protein kinase
MTDAVVNQTVAGRGNIVTGTGDINVSYVLSPADARERQELLILASRVREFWVHGILEKSVHDAALMELGKEARPEAVENPWDTVLSLPDSTKENISPSEPLRELFARVSYTLLILGEPGSGKTVTLLQLARELLTASESDSRLPVPVVFNLSSWSGTRLPIFNWVIEELRTKYYVPAQSGRASLETNRLLLLFDGLDEVQAADRGACIHAINEFMATHGVSGLAICSRQREYLELETRLRLGGAISLQPLSDAQVDNYLRNGGQALQPLREMVANDEDLKNLARTPLMLNIMTLAYPMGAAVPSVKGEGAESLREHIFAAYVEQMFNRRRIERGFSATQVRHYLHELALRLQRSAVTVFMLDEIQPDWLRQSRSETIVYWYVTRLIGCSILAAAISIPVAWLPSNTVTALLVGCIAIGFLGAMVEGTADLCFTRKSIQMMRGSALGIGIRAAWSLLAYSTPFLLLFLASPSESSPIFFAFAAGLTAVIYLSGVYIFHAARSKGEQDIFPADRIVWQWRGMWKGVPWGIAWVVVVTAGCVLWNSVSMMTMEVAIAFAFAVVGGAAVGIAFAGLRPIARTDKIRPNDGIRLAFSNGLKCAATLGVFIGCLVAIGISGIKALLLMRTTSEKVALIDVGTPIWLLAIIVIVGFCYGWLDVIHHWILRLLLYWRNVLPLRAVRFLNYSCDLIFLQRVGAGYIFIHRLILDYFASLQMGEDSPGTTPTE